MKVLSCSFQVNLFSVKTYKRHCQTHHLKYRLVTVKWRYLPVSIGYEQNLSMSANRRAVNCLISISEEPLQIWSLRFLTLQMEQSTSKAKYHTNIASFLNIKRGREKIWSTEKQGIRQLSFLGSPQFAPISGGHLALETHSHPCVGQSNSNFSQFGLILRGYGREIRVARAKTFGQKIKSKILGQNFQP